MSLFALAAASDTRAVVVGSADFLSMEPSARLSGTAGAAVGTHLGSLGVFVAPTSILNGGRPRVDASYVIGLMDTTYSYLSGSRASSAGAAAGLGLAYVRTAKIDVVVQSGALVSSVPVYDLALAVALARRVSDAVSLGVSLKAFTSQLFDTRSNGAALDLEAAWQPASLSPGRAVFFARNLGYASAHVQSGGITPAGVGVACSVPWEFDEGNRLLFSALALVPLDRRSPASIHAGVEYFLGEWIVLRAGYRSGSLENHVTGGAGFLLSDAALDYAILPFSQLGFSHRVSVGWRFH